MSMTTKEMKRQALRYVQPIVVYKAMTWQGHVEAILDSAPHTWDWFSEDRAEGQKIARAWNDRFRRIALLSLSQNGPRGIVVI